MIWQGMLWGISATAFGRRNKSSTWTQAFSQLYDLLRAGATVVIPFAIVLCFVLGALGWWLAVHTEAKAVPGCYEWKFGSQSSKLRRDPPPYW